MSRIIDYYALLGLEHSANVQEIKVKIHSKLKELHPDRTQNYPEELRIYANSRFQLIMQAKKILLDPTNKALYDRKLKQTFKPTQCPKCGYINYLPDDKRRGKFVCRQCSAELFTLKELPIQPQFIENLLLASLLTIRNLGLQNMAFQELEIAKGEKIIKIKSTKERNFLKVYTQFQDTVDRESLLLGIKKGKDRIFAQRLIQRLQYENGPWILRIMPLNNRWAQWSSVFIASSLFPLSPGEARNRLQEFSWNLIELLRLYSIKSQYLNDLKSNWKAMITPYIY